ncbi:vacuolar protein sorting-associated protein 37B-like [Xyrauchen texanus]|uniref:vacuolar protein sorting-associated protein 37B-like n=1 Tax=Xyrauchen texanus TaxID=154827 RepID=UPI0022429B11|nr:vacuolar protein sorting-associated protein 37B-like [Xyrauchen texanus]
MAGFGNKLSSYSLTQLNELLEDEEKLNTIINETEEIKGLQQNKEMTLASNRLLAKQNLQHQPRLDHQKNELTKHYRCLQERFEACQLRMSNLDHKSGNIPLDTLLALLQAEGAKIEEETENMAESFLDGAASLDTFIDEYQSKRKLAHLRRVKIEKLQEMVLKGHQIPSAAPQPSRSQDLPSRPAAVNGSPMPMPRRAPPLPPVNVPPSPTIQPAAAVSYPPTSPYPPIPPRVGNPPSSLNQGYPSMYMQQYPPTVPQRPHPRMAPQPGFIMQ